MIPDCAACGCSGNDHRPSKHGKTWLCRNPRCRANCERYVSPFERNDE